MQTRKIKIINEVVAKTISDEYNNNPPFTYIRHMINYDINNRESKYEMYDLKRGKLISRTVHEYKEGFEKCLEFDSIGLLHLSNYELNQFGNRIRGNLHFCERRGDSQTGSPEFYSLLEFKYDNKQNCIEKYKTDRDGNFWSRTQYVYDENGFLSREKELGYFEEVLYTINFTHDNQGHVFETMRTTNVYINPDNSYGPGEQSTKKEIVVTNYQYEYDKSKSEWIKRVKYIQGRFNEIICREIEYKSENDLLSY